MKQILIAALLLTCIHLHAQQTYSLNVQIDQVNCTLSAESINKVLIYPNPAKESVLLSIDSELIKITDLSGKNYPIKYISNNHLNVSDLLDGIYLLHFIKDEETMTMKLKILKR